MEKDLNYYIGLPYKIELERDPDTNIYVASIPLLKGCITCGDDEKKALVNLEDAKKQWIATALEHSIPIPEPSEDILLYSGQLRLRVPRSLHKALSQNAKEEGVSMNQYCISLLSSLTAYKAASKAHAYKIEAESS